MPDDLEKSGPLEEAAPPKEGAVGKWIRQERERRGWSKAELGRRVGVSGPAIGLYESSTKSPRREIHGKLVAIFGSTDKEDRGGDVAHVSEALASDPPQAIRVGVPKTWDAAPYISYDDLLYIKGVRPSFSLIDGWSSQALDALQDHRYDAIIHNRFLISQAKETHAHLDLRMSHPLYIYRGQFIFVHRQFVVERIEWCKKSAHESVRDKAVAALEVFLQNEYDLLGRNLSFPILNPLARWALMVGNPRFAYVPGTDLEEALQQLYNDSVTEQIARPNPHLSRVGKWRDRGESREKEYAAFHDLERRFGAKALLQQVEERFRKPKRDASREEREFDVFCGGIGQFWDIGNGADRDKILTLCEPRELAIPSLNGLVAQNETILDMAQILDQAASASYVGAQLFKEWYQSIRFKEDEEEEEIGHAIPESVTRDSIPSSAHLNALCRVAEMARPLDPYIEAAGRRSARDGTGKDTVDPQAAKALDKARADWDAVKYDRKAYAWARLISRYVDYFTRPREANAAALDPDAGEFILSIETLTEDYVTYLANHRWP